MGRLKKYTNQLKCCKCKKKIAEYNEDNQERVLKAYVNLCIKCFEKLED